MHPKLVKVNVALFQGARLEAQRYLQEYVEECERTQEGDPDAPLVLWLDSQAQTTRDRRIKRLRDLIASVEPDNHYARLAQAYLQQEEEYHAKLHPPSTGRRFSRTVFGVSLLKILIFAAMGGILTFIGLSAFNLIGAPGQTVAAGASGTPAALPTVPRLPDYSQALVADSFTARYPDGILQVVALEDGSQRVIDTGTMTLVNPVPGARFYALNVVFECRKAICNEPPQAQLALRLATGGEVEARPGVGIAGARAFEPIALGRTTTGWVVFEIPTVSPADALVVLPAEETTGGTPEPRIITIEIP